MKIIPATESHVNEIVEMWKEVMDFHKGIDPFFSRRIDGHLNFEKFLRYSIESEDFLVQVAIDDFFVVAYSIAEIDNHPPVFVIETYGFISDIAVKPGYRRKGIGGQMLDKIYEWFEARDIDRIELRVAAKNRMGYSFWKKHGFNDYMHVLYQNKQKRKVIGNDEQCGMQ